LPQSDQSSAGPHSATLLRADSPSSRGWPSHLLASCSPARRFRCFRTASRITSERSTPSLSDHAWSCAASASSTRKLTIVIHGAYHVIHYPTQRSARLLVHLPPALRHSDLTGRITIRTGATFGTRKSLTETADAF